MALILAVIALFIAGCENKFFNPTQIGRFRPVPAVNVILDTLGVAEETPSTWAGAEDPRPMDIIVHETDYVLTPGDTVRVSIFELLQEGQIYIDDYSVTETGKISIPDVGVIEAAGLTESELEETIKQILSPSILKEPSVAVILVNSQQRTYSILGDAVPNPSRYGMPRYSFRLTDALATAGGVSQFNVSYVYVARPITGKEEITDTLEPEAEPSEAESPDESRLRLEEMLEIIAPRAQRQVSAEQLVTASGEMITDAELIEAALPEGFDPLLNEKIKNKAQLASPKLSDRETIDEPIKPSQSSRIEWVFQDGRWIPVQIGQPLQKEPATKEMLQKTEPLREKLPESFDWDQIEAERTQTRLIKIPTDKLFGGDHRYNIVIRPGDTIHVPLDIIGEFSIMGNVNNTGFIPITGRPINLKQAIAAAGGLGPLAWPKSCEVVRRIGKNKEEIVMVDLDKIASGEQPDFFIKPNDLINVGTHPTARWRAVLRNAFRATYGFGFIYDRNFGDRDFGTSRPIPNWF